MSLKKKIIGLTLGLVTIFGVSVPSVSANTDLVKSNDVTVTIQAGQAEDGEGGSLHLKIADVEDFGQVKLKETAQVYHTSFNDKFTVTDLRGTHEGWRLDVSATQFENENGHKLPKGSLSIQGLERIEGAGNQPTIGLTGTSVIDDGAVNIATAVEGTGAGVFNLYFPEDALSVVVDPTTAKVGTYTSTITWELQSTPDAQ